MTIKKSIQELRAARWEDLTPEERRERDRIAFERIHRIRAEVAADNGGPSTTKSEDLIREMREERDRELMERMGIIPVGDDEAWERVRELERAAAERKA